MEILNEVGKSEIQNGGRTIIRIDPADPNDTWNFDFTLVLSFDDDSKIRIEEHGIQLDGHHSREREFQIMHH